LFLSIVGFVSYMPPKAAKAAGKGDQPLPVFNRRLRCTSCSRAKPETDFPDNDLFGPPERRKCHACRSGGPPSFEEALQHQPPHSEPPAQEVMWEVAVDDNQYVDEMVFGPPRPQPPPQYAPRPLPPQGKGKGQGQGPAGRPQPTSLGGQRINAAYAARCSFPEAIIEPLIPDDSHRQWGPGPGTPAYSPRRPSGPPSTATMPTPRDLAPYPPAPPAYQQPRSLPEAAFKEYVRGIHGWLQICKKGPDPDPRVLRGVSIVSHVRPNEWLAGHPAADTDHRRIEYECGEEVVTRFFQPLLTKAKLMSIPHQLLEAVRDFVDRNRPVVTVSRGRIQREFGGVETLEALFFETGWQAWAAVGREYMVGPGRR
jgi:hypothetical protein